MKNRLREKFRIIVYINAKKSEIQIELAEEIHFENGLFYTFQDSVTLTLTSDRDKNYIFM